MIIEFLLLLPDEPELILVAEDSKDRSRLTKINGEMENCHNLCGPIRHFAIMQDKSVEKLTLKLTNFLNGRRFGNPGILEDLEAAIVVKCESLKSNRGKK